jgi:hypothetical protein
VLVGIDTRGIDKRGIREDSGPVDTSNSMMSAKEELFVDSIHIETVRMKERNMLIGQGSVFRGVGEGEGSIVKAHDIRKRTVVMARQ